MTELTQKGLEYALVEIQKATESRDFKINVGPTMIIMVPYPGETAVEFLKRCNKAQAIVDANTEAN